MDFAVIGIGRFGSAVVRTLYEMGHHVLAIDRDEDALRSVQDSSTHSVQLDSPAPEALRAVGITNFDGVVVVPGAETELRAGDVLVVFGEKQALARLESSL